MQRIKEICNAKWEQSFDDQTVLDAITALENGQILLLPNLAFQLESHENQFLTADIVSPKSKNISFNAKNLEVSGLLRTKDDAPSVRKMLQRFASTAEITLRNLLPFYGPALQIGRTSFRPVEISGRATSYRKDDTRLHVDAFPATPNHGMRILRFFTNINPHNQARHWRVGDTFPNVVEQFLPKVTTHRRAIAKLFKALKITKSLRSEYDHIMLHIHDQMKGDMAYQAQTDQQDIYFPPDCSWIVQTDQVSHAAMAGQFVLEQTFYLPVAAMANPAQSPLKILEKRMGRVLV